MNILFVSSELAPFAKTGGLADVSAALPLHLARRGHDVRAFLPLYKRVRAEGRVFTPVSGLQNLEFTLGPHTVRFSIYTSKLPGSDLDVYFVSCPSLYDRDGIYTRDADEHIRFLTLTWAALVSAQHMGFAPDIAHGNDWQCGLLPLTIKTRFSWDRLFKNTKTILTIHNLAHQGIFPASVLPETGLADNAQLFHQDHLREGRMSFLETGILYADAITTVSPTYSREIQTDEQGGELAGLLRERSRSVVGILNGIDDEEWDPERDRFIPHRYSVKSLRDKERNKHALLSQLGLPYVEGVPLAGIVSRLAAQKGLELVIEALPPLLARGRLQFVVLGSGATTYEEAFALMQRRFPRAVAFYKGFSNPLAHLIEAGADLFLMPSRFEPCGLNQMYSLRYGTPPVVRKTGGLADTVEHFDRRTRRGTGFVFDHFTVEGLSWALREALATWEDRAAWRELVQNGMAENFSWRDQIKKYELLYERSLRER